MMGKKAWNEKHHGKHYKGNEIGIRLCECGSIHLSFFGRTTYHLSRQEFLDFSRGVAEATNNLKQMHQDDPFSSLRNDGLSH